MRVSGTQKRADLLLVEPAAIGDYGLRERVQRLEPLITQRLPGAQAIAGRCSRRFSPDTRA